MAGKPAAIQVEGAVELRRALKRMGADVGDLTAINREAAKIVADTARGRAPVRSGRLRRSIKERASKTRASVSAGDRLVPYAGPIHFGWPRRNIEPAPFLYDALDERRQAVADRYAARIGELVVRVGRETP